MVPTWVIFGVFFVFITAVLSKSSLKKENLAIAVALCFLLLILFLLTFRKTRAPESYTEIDESTGSELITPEIGEKMKFYISMMGYNSFKDGDYVWTDISNHTDVDDEGQLVIRNFQMSELPPFDKLKDGVSLKNIKLRGPDSVNVGIRGNDNFTVFWFSQNTSKLTERVPIFTMYANTYSNIGFEISMEQENDICKIVVSEALGSYKKKDHTIVVQNTSFMGAQHVYAVTRDVDTINKRCEVNTDLSWDGTLIALGAYRKALTGTQLVDLHKYLQGRQVQLTDQYQLLIGKQRINQQKQSCALRSQIYCDTYCKNIKDWTNITDVMVNASEECKQRINDYCLLHTEEEFCKCWSMDMKNNANCRFVRGFFGNDLSASNMCTTAKHALASREPSLDRYYGNKDGSFALVAPDNSNFNAFLGPVANRTKTAAVKVMSDNSGVADTYNATEQTKVLEKVYADNIKEKDSLLKYLNTS
eukprot:gene19594-26277_t